MLHFPLTFMKIFNKTELAVSKDSIFFPDYSALWRSGISDSLIQKNLSKAATQKEDRNWFSIPIIAYGGQKYCRMLQESILQYFRPPLSYHLSLRSLFCLF